MSEALQPLGKHQARIDGDIIWVRVAGQLELSEIIGLFKLGYEVGDRYGYMMFLGDARHAIPPSAEARRYQVEQLKVRSQPSHTAIYGANFVVRAFLTLTQRAAELVTGKPPPITFHKDEATARMHLDRTRPSLQLKAQASAGT